MIFQTSRMTKKLFSPIFAAWMLVIFASMSLDAYPFNDETDDHELSQKCYVCREDILILEDGLFVIESGELVSVSSIGVDEEGFYIIGARDSKIGPRVQPTCFNGHPVYHKECGGCANWWCTLRCKCYAPW